MILKMNINMTDITEKTDNGELVTNRDQLVVVDNIESLIKVIRELQVMLDKDLATFKITDCDFERRTRTKYKEIGGKNQQRVIHYFQ